MALPSREDGRADDRREAGHRRIEWREIPAGHPRPAAVSRLVGNTGDAVKKRECQGCPFPGISAVSRLVGNTGDAVKKRECQGCPFPGISALLAVPGVSGGPAEVPFLAPVPVWRKL